LSRSTAATPEGTAAYAQRFEGRVDAGHFRRLTDLTVGSIGLGTYLGSHDDETDQSYERAIVEAVKLGCNHFDTAINYRCMRSEKSVGRSLASLFEEGAVSREEIVVATKGGYVPFDGAPPVNIRDYIRSAYIEPGVVDEDELVGSVHALAPRFLERQITRSLENLRIDRIDIYYLHNPEVHRAVLTKQAFFDRLRRAFVFLEEEAARGRIARYGVSSMEAFRALPSSPVHIALTDLVDLARDAGGDDHHFASIQLPFSPVMMEGYALVSQEVDGETISTVDAATRLGIAVTTSAPFLQGRLLRAFPHFLDQGMKDLGSKAEKGIQFARSIPGVASVLVGMSQALHVAENLTLARRPSLTLDELMGLFSEE